MHAIAAAKKAIADATELPEAETTAHAMVVNAHANILATAKESRMAVLDDKTKEEQAIAKAATNKVALTKENRYHGAEHRYSRPTVRFGCANGSSCPDCRRKLQS